MQGVKKKKQALADNGKHHNDIRMHVKNNKA
jgi:hypothetical protein